MGRILVGLTGIHKNELSGERRSKMFRKNWFQFSMPGAVSLVLLVLMLLAGTTATADINDQVAQLDFDTADLNDVIEIFGEPTEYRWGDQIYQRDELPVEIYVLFYPDGFLVYMMWDSVHELRFAHPDAGFLFHGQIEIGSSLEDVLAVVGQPTEIVEGQPNGHQDGVLYKDIDGTIGRCAYRRDDLNVWFWFHNYNLTMLILTGNLIGPVDPITFPKIDRRPEPSPMCVNRGSLASIPTYDPNNINDAFQVDLRSYDLSALDLTSSLYDLLYSVFDNQTTWPPPEQMPAGFYPELIMELGKNPGLGVRDLHAQGVTGLNVGIAIIDEPLLTEHQEYADQLRLYEEINIGSWDKADMHATAVASIAVGRTIGVAPEADLYYIAAPAADWIGPGQYIRNLHYRAQAIRRILEINEQLPENRKIRVISTSVGWRPEHIGYDDIMAACEEAKAAGMLIVSSSINRVHPGFLLLGLGRHPLADPDNFESYEPGIFWAQWFYDDLFGIRRTDRLLVPMDSRSPASPCAADEFFWQRTGGISWSIPYVAGLYALAAQVNPEITPEQFWSEALETGHIIDIVHNNETIPLGTIVDPAALIGPFLPPINQFDDVRNQDLSDYDFSDRPDLIDTLTFNQDTIWPQPENMPPGCDPPQLMTDAMNPGLGVRALHQQGTTGAGVNVAIIDQPLILTHPEYAGKIVAYHDVGCEGAVSSMHGPAVASLLVGTNCGTAPDAQVYYVAVPSWKKDAAYYAQALHWIIAQNETLAPSQKIRLVSVSAQPSGPGAVYINQQMWDDAVAQAEATGILVLDGTWQNGFVSVCWYDADDPENVTACTPGFRADSVQVDAGHVHAPTAPRTTAEVYSEGGFSHIYWGGTHRSPLPDSKAGYSWAIPYCAGVLAMGWQIRPELTGDQIVGLLFQTAYVDSHGAQIINPQDFISFLAANEPAIQVSTQQFDFYAVTGSPCPDPQILSISNAGSGTLNWVIDYECNWLDVEPNSGTSVGETDITDVTLTITDLTPGVYTCELTISDPCAINGPLSVVVTLYVADGNQPTIQSLIDAVENGDTVVVPPGAYFGDGNRDLDFKGKAITVRSIDPNDPDVVAATIIVCQGTEAVPHRGFHFHNNEDANSVLNGLTIHNGYESSGGAIYCDNSSPTIINCVLVGNSADWGGGMYCLNCSPTVVNCTFADNSANYGGGLRNLNSSTTVTTCTFTGNSVVNWGGGMTNRNCTSSLTVTNCTFTNNSANWGAGMRNYDTNSTVTNCTFTNNSATDRGGGMDNVDGSNPTVTNCSFTGNSAANLGGGMDNSPGCNPIVTNCIFSRNSATFGGGGIDNAYANNPTITNCIFSGNSALNYGGGMNNFNGSNPTVTNCTFTGNSAANGGGMYNSLSSSSTLTNCIFWANSATGLTDESAQVTGGTRIINYSCVQGWTGILDGIGNIGADPCFVDPGHWADANDPNVAVEPNEPNAIWVEGDYHLLPGSPCINTGDPNYMAGPDEIDIDGQTRVFDGRIEMGADEFVPPIQVPVKFTPQAMNVGSKGKWVKAHIVLPAHIAVDDVDLNTPATLRLLGIELSSEYMNVFLNEDGLVEIEAAFDRQVLCGLTTSNQFIELTVEGLLTSGQSFRGTDTVKITNNNFACLAVLASHWLRSDCGKPDWCNGADLDQDDVVNFKDFAMLDGCCIEITAE